MEGYKLRLRGLPEPVFAFRITAENYVWENTAPAGRRRAVNHQRRTAGALAGRRASAGPGVCAAGYPGR